MTSTCTHQRMITKGNGPTKCEDCGIPITFIYPHTTPRPIDEPFWITQDIANELFDVIIESIKRGNGPRAVLLNRLIARSRIDT